MLKFDQPSEEAAFERWVDITAQLLQKYGPALLKPPDKQPVIIGTPFSEPNALDTLQNAA